MNGTDALPPFAAGLLPAGVTPHMCDLGDLRMHYLMAGEAKDDACVLLLHGFPELAFSWRKNMLPLAEAGHCVIAPDLRGFGRTAGWDGRYGAPLAPFAALSLMGDVLRLVTALGFRTVRLAVGHDSGARIASLLALLRPDVVRAAVAMSTPFTGAPPRVSGQSLSLRPLTDDPAIRGLGALRPPRKHYAAYYAGPEANRDLMEAPQGVTDWFLGYFFAKSAGWAGNRPRPLPEWSAEALAEIPTYYIMNRDETMAETVLAYWDPSEGGCPTAPWMTRAEAAVYAGEYARTGFQGGLNGYRCDVAGLNDRLTAPFAGMRMRVPYLYVAGEADWGTWQFAGAARRMAAQADDFRDMTLIPGAGHWVQQEQPERTNAALLRFLEETGAGRNGRG